MTNTIASINKKNRKVGRPSSNGQSQVQSLTRALSLLECLSNTEKGLNLSDVSGSLGLAPSTTHRLLSTMLQMGFVEFDEDQGLWYVGVRAFSVGNAYLKKRDFVAQSRPFMKKLMLISGETCNLGIMKQETVIFVAQVECLEVMRMVVQLGSRGPLHATGVGKAMLATLPHKEVMSLIQKNGLPRLTENTITTPKLFLDDLKKTKEQGYAVDDEEQSLGLRCIASCIYDERSEPIAAVSISGPTVRITKKRLPALSRHVIDIADEITMAIGGVKPIDL
jgi:IclR family transcriptional regulator, acetate operon repressor